MKANLLGGRALTYYLVLEKPGKKLVAVSGEKIVGYIFFSPAAIDHQDGQVVGMGLAPMAVLPEYQKQGIEMSLMRQ